MKKLIQIAIALAAAVVMAAAAMDSIGAGPAAKRETIPGSELTTSEEREQYRQRMRAAKTPDAQAAVRTERVR